MGPRYLDAASFTRLFRHRRKNHAQICLGLALIVNGIARLFSFKSPDLRADIKANALLAAIERIDRFSFKVGGDAFAYYSAVVRHSMGAQFSERTCAPSVTLFSDIDCDRGWMRRVGLNASAIVDDRATPYARAPAGSGKIEGKSRRDSTSAAA
jgi:hypothetical protein